MNYYDMGIIVLLVLIIAFLMVYKFRYCHSNCDDIDKQVDNILNSKDIIQQKHTIPKNLPIEDFNISEVLIKNNSIAALVEEVKKPV